MGEGKTGEDHPEGGIRQILHDLNQPLTAINNYAQAGRHLIENGVPDEQKLKDLFDKIAAQTARSFEISRTLRAAVVGKNSDQGKDQND